MHGVMEGRGVGRLEGLVKMQDNTLPTPTPTHPIQKA